MAFGKLADFAGSLTKGAHIAIEGDLRSREYLRRPCSITKKQYSKWNVTVDTVKKSNAAMNSR